MTSHAVAFAISVSSAPGSRSQTTSSSGSWQSRRRTTQRPGGRSDCASLASRALGKALQGGRLQTRDELREVFAQPGIKTDGALRMGYLMMHAELEGVVCSGPRRGKQFTYALLDERVSLPSGPA